MDRKTIAAVALCVLFLVFYRPLLDLLGLGRYLRPAAPTRVAEVDSTRRDMGRAPAVGQPPAPGAASSGVPDSAVLGAGVPESGAEIAERAVEIETPLYRMAFSSRGARLLWIELKYYASARGITGARGGHLHHRRGEMVPPGDRVVLAGGPLFGLDLGSGPTLRSLARLTYAVSESADASGTIRAVTFTADQPSGLHVRQTYRVHPDNFVVDLAVELTGIPEAWRVSSYSLTQRSWPLLTEADMAADARALKATSLVGTNIHREHPGGLLKGPKSFDGNVKWAAVQSRYFIGAVGVIQAPARGVVSTAERRTLPPEQFERLPQGSKPQQDVAINSLVLGLPSSGEPVHHFLLYVGPGEYPRLSALKIQLERAIDMGWSWVLPFSKVLLNLLNWLHEVLRNYGVAILVLATLVRLLLHPLNMVSMRSMRAMQKLQPEIERIKEKYKKDPQAMNTAVMALYKEHKVNPAGGCLPMLLQMPLFLALYQVLFNAIELRQAPFFGWMNDLSAPDLLVMAGPFPIRLLPLVMAASGYLSQRLTPTDPRQAPTMYMMNLLMLVFFYNLPSGLVLYWTVMNLLTALQQWLILRQDGTVPAPVAAPAALPKKGRAASR